MPRSKSRVQIPSPAPAFSAPKDEEGFLSLPGLRGILYVAAVTGECPATADHGLRRGTQVVRERSAKPLYVGSIPTRASTVFPHLREARGPSLRSGFRLRSPAFARARLTPARRLKFDSHPRLQLFLPLFEEDPRSFSRFAGSGFRLKPSPPSDYPQWIGSATLIANIAKSWLSGS